VKDCIEPRVKLSGGNGKEYFPGFCSLMQRAGSDATLVLDGAAVVTCGSIVAFQEGFIDMSGEGARYTHFSKTNNVVLVVEPVEGLDKHKYEAALRIAGLKLATYLARACKDSKADEVATFEKGSIAEESAKYPDLPKILYVCMSIAQGLLHDTYVYGTDVKMSFPFLLHPNEVLDGAVVSGNCVSACDKNTTYHHVNNPVVCDLYERHGKDLNFLGVVISPESTVLAGKERNARMSAAIGAELGADGAVITEEGYGNPDRLRVSSAESCAKYDISGLDDLIPDEFESIHGGYDRMWANLDPDVVVPLDVMRELEREGVFNKLHPYLYTTTGTGTSVANAERFGQEIGRELKEAGVDGVILTST